MFIEFVKTANLALLIVLLVAVVFAFMAISAINRRVNRLRRRYDILLRGKTDLDLEALLVSHGRELDDQNNRLLKLNEDIIKYEEDLGKKIAELDGRSLDSIQKIGFHRYNAFEYMTSESSFSLALLDSRLDGIVITSIFGRDQSTIYAKEIVEGKALQDLSIEEEIALGRAVQKA